MFDIWFVWTSSTTKKRLTIFIFLWYKKKVKPGIFMNLVAILIQLAFINTLGRVLFNLNEFPEWATINSTSLVTRMNAAHWTQLNNYELNYWSIDGSFASTFFFFMMKSEFDNIFIVLRKWVTIIYRTCSHTHTNIILISIESFGINPEWN